MNKLIKLVFSLVFVGFLTGCAMQSVYNIAPEKTVGSLGGVSLVIEDNRPKKEKDKSYGSFLVGSSDYGIWTLGDESFRPKPIDALHQRVLQAISQLAVKPKNITISVKHLVIQDNQQAYLLKDGSASLGPLGIAIAQSMHGKDFEFDHDKTLPFVIAFFQAEVDIDGDKREVSFSKSNNYKSNTDAEGRDRATTKTAKDFFESIGNIVVN